MSTPRYAAIAARLLKFGEAPPASVSAKQREQRIEVIRAALRAKRRRRRLQVLAAAVTAAAACFALWFAVGELGRTPVQPLAPPPNTLIGITAHPLGEGARLLAPEGDLPVPDGHSLASGERLLVEPRGAVELALSTGTKLSARERSSVEVREHGSTQRFFLGSGALEARVAKLLHDQRFIVDTPDTQVEVRGTRFVLSVVDHPAACDQGVRTHLSVSEGVVEVRSRGTRVRVRAGEQWPPPCPPEPESSEQAPAPARAPKPPPRLELHKVAPEPEPGPAHEDQPSSAVETPAAREIRARSELAAQNKLFAEGVAARRQGDMGAALGNYESLIRSYPKSALAENAMVERMRLLRRRAPQAAAREAERYLAQYPAGFARAEADAIVREAK